MRKTSTLWALCILLFPLLAGCPSQQEYNLQRLESLPHRYRQFDLVLAWEIKTEGSQTVIDGVVKNVRFPYVNDLEISAAWLDLEGRVVSRAVTFVIPIQIERDSAAPFTLRFPTIVSPGARLRITYKYRADEVGRGGGFNWFQSFDTTVPVY